MPAPRSDRAVILDFTNHLLDELSKPYLHYMREEFHRLKVANQAITGNTAYLVGSTVFAEGMRVLAPGLYRAPAKPLPPQLMDQHETWLVHWNRHQTEWGRACQAVRTVMARANTDQDIRDLLPDRVLRPVLHQSPLSELTRTRPDIYAGPPPLAGGPEEAEWQARVVEREQLWGPKPVALYAKHGPIIDLYVGYALL